VLSVVSLSVLTVVLAVCGMTMLLLGLTGGQAGMDAAGLLMIVVAGYAGYLTARRAGGFTCFRSENPVRCRR